MLQRIQAEVARYERVISYWPSFGPSLEAAVCAALRTTTAAVSRQCGLIPMIGVGCLLPPTSCFAFVGVQVTWETLCHMKRAGLADLTQSKFVGIAAPCMQETSSTLHKAYEHMARTSLFLYMICHRQLWATSCQA